MAGSLTTQPAPGEPCPGPARDVTPSPGRREARSQARQAPDREAGKATRPERPGKKPHPGSVS
jgi:hypothetical protein